MRGGTFEMSGTLTPVSSTPWEVFVGDAVSGLDSDILVGETTVDIPVSQAIPVLGIRTAKAVMFAGGTGITPQINYNGGIDITKFASGVAPLSLEVKNADDNSVIGTLEGSLTAGGIVDYIPNSTDTDISHATNFENVAASKSGYLFYGGVSTSADSTLGVSEVMSRLGGISSQFIANVSNSTPTKTNSTPSITDTSSVYTAAYGSGIEAGTSLRLKLNQAVSSGAIHWKASLPITVTYE